MGKFGFAFLFSLVLFALDVPDVEELTCGGTGPTDGLDINILACDFPARWSTLEISGISRLQIVQVQRTALGEAGIALMKAASYGHESFIRLLLSRKADPTKENRYGTALHAAAEAGQVSVILELVETGVDVNIRGRQGRSPLHCATVSGHRNAIETLLDLGADINLICDNHYTALKYAILWEHSLEIVKILLERGTNTEIRSDNCLTALHHAAVMNHGEATLLLLKYGANVYAEAAHIGTPLHLAAIGNHPVIIQHLLENGAEIDARTEDDVSALDLAARNGSEKSVQMLIEGGADIEAADQM